MRVLVTGSIGHVARSPLGWAPRMPLDEGIPRAVAWFREHRTAHPEEDRPVTPTDAEIGWKAYAAGGDPAL